MLTKSERQKLLICNEYLATRSTNRDLAKKFNLAECTIARALAWGREQGMFESDTEQKIRQNILELQKILSGLEKEYQACLRASQKQRKTNKKYTFGLTYNLSGLAKRILEYKTRILELEGLYHKVIELKGGKDTGKLQGPLLQMVIAITGEGNDNNQAGN